MPQLDQSKSFLGPAFMVLSGNVEGFSSAKQQILVELCSDLHCDVLYLLAGDPLREQQYLTIHSWHGTCH